MYKQDLLRSFEHHERAIAGQFQDLPFTDLGKLVLLSAGNWAITRNDWLSSPALYAGLLASGSPIVSVLEKSGVTPEQSEKALGRWGDSGARNLNDFNFWSLPVDGPKTAEVARELQRGSIDTLKAGRWQKNKFLSDLFC